MAYQTSDGYIGVAKQSVKGTGVTPTAFKRFESETLKAVKAIDYIPEGGHGRDTRTALESKASVGGDVVQLARPTMLARYMAWALGIDYLGGTAVGSGGSGGLSAQAASGQAACAFLPAASLFPFSIGDKCLIGAANTALAEVGTILSFTGHLKPAGGSTTVASEALSGQKVINVASATDIIGGDYIYVGATTTLELLLVDSVNVNAITVTTNLKYTHAIAAVVVECDLWTITMTSNLLYTHAIAATVVEMQAPWIHYANLADTIPWLTVERSIAAGTHIDRFVDCKIGSVKLSGEAGKALKVTATFAGITQALQASETSETYDTADDPYPFKFHSGSFYRDGSLLNGSISDVLTTIPVNDGGAFLAAGGDTILIDNEEILVGGVTANNLTTCTRAQGGTTATTHPDNARVYLKVSNITKFDLEFTNGLAEDIYCNALTRKDIMEGMRGVKLSFTQLLDRAVDLKRAFVGTSTATAFNTGIYQGHFRIKITSNAYDMDLEIPCVVYENMESHLNPDTKPMYVESAGVGLKQDASTALILCNIETADSTAY